MFGSPPAANAFSCGKRGSWFGCFCQSRAHESNRRDVPATNLATPWSMRSKRAGSSGFTSPGPPTRSIFTSAITSFA